eukprot:4897341-Amphidinium_carterae.2
MCCSNLLEFGTVCELCCGAGTHICACADSSAGWSDATSVWTEDDADVVGDVSPTPSEVGTSLPSFKR